MEARVEVIAEDPVSGVQSRTNTAYAVYVALSDEREPRPVAPLKAETETEARRMKEGKKRQAYRLENRREAQESTE
jgi:acyl-CoA hydrolase